MWLIKLLTLIIIYSSFNNAIAANQLVYYEPTIAKLTGLIRLLKFPGPPNYESIKNGDANETSAYLILNKPINIALTPKIQIGNDTPENNIKMLQLIVLNNSDLRKILAGNHVSIIGTLSHALTGHHHARVLLTVKKVKVLSPQRNMNNKLDITNEDREFLQHEHLQT